MWDIGPLDSGEDGGDPEGPSERSNEYFFDVLRLEDMSEGVFLENFFISWSSLEQNKGG